MNLFSGDAGFRRFTKLHRHGATVPKQKQLLVVESERRKQFEQWVQLQIKQVFRHHGVLSVSQANLQAKAATQSSPSGITNIFA